MPSQLALAEGRDHESREEDDQQPDHEPGRHRLAAEERPVRPSVDDVEGALERAEEAERRPEQQPEADEPDHRREVLDLVHGADDRRDLALREHPGQLPDEIRRFVGAPEQPEQRHGEERQRDERQERVVRDHRGELRATVGLELHEQLALPDAH